MGNEHQGNVIKLYVRPMKWCYLSHLDCCCLRTPLTITKLKQNTLNMHIFESLIFSHKYLSNLKNGNMSFLICYCTSLSPLQLTLIEILVYDLTLLLSMTPMHEKMKKVSFSAIGPGSSKSFCPHVKVKKSIFWTMSHLWKRIHFSCPVMKIVTLLSTSVRTGSWGVVGRGSDHHLI